LPPIISGETTRGSAPTTAATVKITATARISVRIIIASSIPEPLVNVRLDRRLLLFR
jgi:hypothetical protein